jgi:hypothetical protein
MQVRAGVGCHEFTLGDSTHKQDDRAYLRLIDNGDDPQSPLRRVWAYSMQKPTGVEGKDYETMLDADEAFKIARQRNERLLRRCHENVFE